jgi:biotin carboxyl carrier protein
MSEVKAPMGGKVIEVLVNPGDAVEEGEEVVIIEAMKMEMPIMTDDAGTVKAVNCKQGDAVEADAVLVVLE